MVRKQGRLAWVVSASLVLAVSACASDSKEATTTSTAAGGSTATTQSSSSGGSTAPGSAPETAAAGGGEHPGDGTISYAFSLGPATLDPAGIKSLQEVLYLNPVYDRLVYIDPLTAEPKPMLATGWTVGSDTDGGFAEFDLRAGLTFPDGSPFDANAVKANLERSMAASGSLVASTLTALESVEVVDADTVRMHTTGGAAWLPATVGGPAGMMISPSSLNSPDLATKPAGIGMWTLDSFDPAQVTYHATPNYWDPSAQQADHLKLNFIGDDAARFNALRAGDIDVTFLRPNQIANAEGEGLQTIKAGGSTTYGFVFNTSRKGLDNQEVRQALNMAVDRQAIADKLLLGYCTPNSQMWAPTLASHNDAVEVPQYDPKAAKEALAAAGYSDGFDMSVVVSDVDQYRRLAEILQAQLGELGVKVTIQVAPAVDVVDIYANRKEADAAQTNPGLESDPSQLVSTYLMPDSRNNPGALQIPGIEDLAQQGLSEGDTAKRTAIYEEISKRAADSAGYLAICSPDFVYGTDGQVADFTGARAGGLVEFRGVKG